MQSPGTDAVFTVTTALALALPPLPVQVRAYVVVAVGETASDPLVACVPFQPLLAVQEVSFVLLQVRLELDPEAMVVGLAEIETVGVVLILKFAR